MSGGASPALVYGASSTPRQIVNGYSANGWFPNQQLVGTGASAVSGMVLVGSGALTANTLKPVISLTGPGLLDFLAVTIQVATVRATRVQIVLDGVTAFDSTSSPASTNGTAALVGMVASMAGTLVAQFDAIPFKSSCVVSVSSSVSESDTHIFSYRWRPA